MRPAVPAEILHGRVVAILRGLAPTAVDEVADVLVSCGIRALEVTLDSPNALDAIRALADRYKSAGLTVGAGTVLELEDARAAVDAGARFLAAPDTEPSLVRWSVATGIPMFPGAFTPTEIRAAWRAGAAAVKLFPGDLGGSGYVRSLNGPLRNVPLIPTGGVNDVTAPQFLREGAIAVGAGSWLIGDGQPEHLAQRARSLVAAIDASPRRPQA
jgi:2-dehydro-3-deoxyphosphogluconate aldolase/(4S)-4-hydroxy-2-oxoglutarate aldolase